MEDIILSLMNQFGYFGVAFLIALENVFPPIPSEVILTFGGFLTTYTKLTIVGVVIAATIGSVLGALVLYGVGSLFNKERLERIVDSKVGRMLCLKKQDIQKADHWFDTKGIYTVFFCRFVPIVRSLISIPAGMSGMPLVQFLLFTTLGTAIWNIILVVLGSFVGSAWPRVVVFMNRYSKLVLLGIVLIFVISVTVFYKKRLGKQKK